MSFLQSGDPFASAAVKAQRSLLGMFLMARRRRKYQHEAGPGQRLKWVWLVLTLTISGATVLLLTDQRRPVSIRISEKPRDPERFFSARSSPPDNPAIGRPLYPFSIISGGIVSVEELRFALAKDRIAAAHFSNFDLSRARTFKLTADRRAYVSYRKHDQIFWTAKKVLLAKGELLVTDGNTYARTRCANQISDVLHGRVSAEEPTEYTLNTPLPTVARDDQPRPRVGLPAFVMFPRDVGPPMVTPPPGSLGPPAGSPNFLPPVLIIPPRFVGGSGGNRSRPNSGGSSSGGSSSGGSSSGGSSSGSSSSGGSSSAGSSWAGSSSAGSSS